MHAISALPEEVQRHILEVQAANPTLPPSALLQALVDQQQQPQSFGAQVQLEAHKTAGTEQPLH